NWSFGWIAIKIHHEIKHLKVPTYDVGLCSVLLVSVLEDAQVFFCHRVQQNDVLPKPQTNYRRKYGLPRGSSSVWWYLCLESSAKYNVLVAEHDDAGSLYKVYAVSYECLGLYLE